MARPKTPNTGAATAKNVRRGHDSAARRLRTAGWVVLDPEQLAALPPDVRSQLPVSTLGEVTP